MIRLEIEPLYIPPTNPKKLMCFKISKHPYFQNFISGCIIFSTVLMALEYYLMD